MDENMDDAPPQLIEAVVEPMDGRACMRCSLHVLCVEYSVIN